MEQPEQRDDGGSATGSSTATNATTRPIGESTASTRQAQSIGQTGWRILGEPLRMHDGRRCSTTIWATSASG